MAGYSMTSFDGQVFQQLTTAPTIEQATLFAEAVGDVKQRLEDAAEYNKRREPDPALWPLDRKALAEVIRKRLASPDWYADFSSGDAEIWDRVIMDLHGPLGEQLGLHVDFYDDAMIWWNAAWIAAKNGAAMMEESKFGCSGFRYSGKSRSKLNLMYSLYLPSQVQELLKQLETAAPHFEALPDEEEGDRHQFFRFLLEPVRDAAMRARVLCIRTDT